MDLPEGRGDLGDSRTSSAYPLGDRAGALDGVDSRDPGGTGAESARIRCWVDDHHVGKVASPQTVHPQGLCVRPDALLQNLGDAVVVDIGMLAFGSAAAAPAHPDARALI